MDFKLAELSRGDPDNYYIGAGGLKRCKKCDCALEMILSSRYREDIKVRCMCKCELDAQEEESKILRKRQIETNRSHCFGSSKLIDARFDDSDNDAVVKTRNYATDFNLYLGNNVGLLLYGKIGAGKSYLAGCIANELIDQGYLVKMSNLTQMVNEMNATFEIKAEYLYRLNRYDLLIIDDFGVERGTEYMLEQLYSIIDARYASGKPMIVTTNLSVEQLNKPSNIELARVYDRIIERCHPVKVEGASRRRKSMRDNYNEIENMLRGVQCRTKEYTTVRII